MDEPTNNLDLASVEQLIAALAGYRGALVVASHDQDFCTSVGITRTWQLTRTAGRIEVVDRPADERLAG